MAACSALRRATPHSVLALAKRVSTSIPAHWMQSVSVTTRTAVPELASKGHSLHR